MAKESSRTLTLHSIPPDIQSIIIAKQTEQMNKLQSAFGREATIYKIIREWGNFKISAEQKKK